MFKLDFSKLTPEAIAAGRATREQEYKATLAARKALISTRIELVEQLASPAVADKLNDYDAKFVSHMESLAQRFGLDGLLGSDLADLTEPQTAYLENLHAKTVEPALTEAFNG